MKKIITFVLPVLMLFVCFFVVGCNSETGKKDLTISNFESYESIAIGISNPQSSLSSFVSTLNTQSDENKNNGKPILIGKTNDGFYKEIRFEEDDSFISTYGISAVQNLGQFLFLNYSQDYTGEVSNTINNTSSDLQYVLDTKSGKMFDITEEKINLYTSGCYAVNENAFYSFPSKTNNNSFYKYSIIDNQLKVQEIFNLNKFKDFGYLKDVDRYGNVYSTNDYILTVDGKLSKLDDPIILAKNNIAYINNTQWINSQGIVEKAQFVPNSFINIPEKYCIYKNNNVQYYRQPDTNDNYSNLIIKYTFDNDIEYEVETIYMEDFEDNSGVVIKNRIYFKSEADIFFINIENGLKTTIISDYFFNKIYSDNQNNLIFEGIDENLNNIVGIINWDNSVTIGITPKQFEIYFIEAL